MRVARRHRRLAGEEIVRRVRMHDRKAGLEQRGFEELADAGLLPLVQRHQDADCRIETGGEVDHRNADARRAAFGRAVGGDHAGHRLHDGVVARIAAARTVGAEAGNPAVDQPRKLLAQERAADAPLVERAGLEVLDQDVGVLQQASSAPRARAAWSGRGRSSACCGSRRCNRRSLPSASPAPTRASRRPRAARA